MRRISGIYPALFAAGYVLAMVGNTSAPAADVLRPLAVVVGGTVLIQLFFWLLLRRADAAAAIALGALAWSVSVAAGLAWLGLVVLWAWRDLRMGRTLSVRPRTSELAVVGGLFLAVTIVNGVMAGVLTPDLRAPTARAAGLATTDAPDIWLILLDGYPRADTLANDYGIDNRPFLNALGARGFDVATRSHSNYTLTSMTLATMFNMAHAADIPILGGLEHADGQSQKRALQDALDDTPVQQLIHRHGYEFITAPPTNIDVATADRNLRGDRLKPFEIYLLQEMTVGKALIALAPDLIPGQHREQVLGTFDALKAVAREAHDQPRLVFGHVLTPHPPFVFRADGSSRPMPACFPGCDFWLMHQEKLGITPAEFTESLDAQIAFTNARTLDLVDAILAGAARPPIIIVWSDHGTRNDLAFPRTEWFRSLFAAYTPGHQELFGDGASPINIFPTLARTYLGESIGDLPDDQYLTLDGTYPLRVKPIAPWSSATGQQPTNSSVAHPVEYSIPAAAAARSQGSG